VQNERNRQREFENGTLRKIFVPNRDEITGVKKTT
jgi:hypothetical protein